MSPINPDDLAIRCFACNDAECGPWGFVHEPPTKPLRHNWMLCESCLETLAAIQGAQWRAQYERTVALVRLLWIAAVEESHPRTAVSSATMALASLETAFRETELKRRKRTEDEQI